MKLIKLILTITTVAAICLSVPHAPNALAAPSCKESVKAKRSALSSANRAVRVAQGKVRSKERKLAQENAKGTRLLDSLQRKVDSATRKVESAERRVDSAKLRMESSLTTLRQKEEELRASILWAGGVACLAEELSDNGGNFSQAAATCARQVALFTARYNVAMSRRQTREKSLQRTVDQNQKRLNEALAARQKLIDELMRAQSNGANKAEIDKAQDELDKANRVLAQAEAKADTAEEAYNAAETSCAASLERAQCQKDSIAPCKAQVREECKDAPRASRGTCISNGEKQCKADAIRECGAV